MRVLKQSSSLREKFLYQVNQKVSNKQQEIHQVLGGGLLGALGSGVFQARQIKNQVQGYLGESSISLLLMSLPDSWVMFKNALIPTSSKSLTEIDLLIIGNGGIFVVEVKTWKGSLSAYKDKWKRRDGAKWIPLDNSPTEQSVYHQKMFWQWIISEVPDLTFDCLIAPVVFPIATWIGATDCSVPVLQGFQDLVKMLNQSPNRLTPGQVLKISQLVENCELQLYLKSKPILRKNSQK